MGHVSGTGLGKHSQGRVDIVESSRQKGRRGLGVIKEGFEDNLLEWDFEKEEVSTILTNCLTHKILNSCLLQSCSLRHAC